MPIVDSKLGTVVKTLERRLEELVIRERIETIKTHINVKVNKNTRRTVDSHGNMMSLRL